MRLQIFYHCEMLFLVFFLFHFLRMILNEVIEVPSSAFLYKDSLISNLAYTKFEAAVSYYS